MSARPTVPLTTLALATVALTMLALTGCGTGSKPSPPTSGASSALTQGTSGPAPAPQTSTAVASNPMRAGGAIAVGDVSLVARARTTSVTVYPTTSTAAAQWILANPLPSGAPLVFLVLEHRGDWLRALVPVRPNQSQGWLRATDVTISQHDYRITISTGRHVLTLYRAGKAVLQAPVGVGTDATPTPRGVFFIKELLRPPDPDGAYGPFAYGLSGFSEVMDDFGGGRGEIGIHGTDEPSDLGKNVSHGCIRLSNENITRLAHTLPLGVPVQITA